MSYAYSASLQTQGAEFLQFLGTLHSAEGACEVCLDFSDLRVVRPAALTTIAATVGRWRKQNKAVTFESLETCPISSYLQRMDLYQTCGALPHDNCLRNSATGRFVPVRAVDHRVEDMSAEMAECLAPGGSEYEHPMSHLWDFSWYVISETANNVQQHSGGVGYATAQVTRQDGIVRLAIADNGRGILKTFQDAGLAWSAGMSDEQALLKALEPRVSSKFGESNEGVGLTLVSRLMHFTGGWLAVISGTGIVTIRKGSIASAATLPQNARYQGTLVALALDRNRIGDYSDLLHKAKVDAGLLPNTRGRAIFE